MRPRSFPSFVAALLVACLAGWLAGAVTAATPAVAYGAPVAVAAEPDTAAVAVLVGDPARVDGLRIGDAVDASSAGAPASVAPTDAAGIPAATAAAQATEGPVAIVTVLAGPTANPSSTLAATVGPPGRAPAPPPQQSPTPSPAPTPRPATPPPSTPPPPPPPPSDTQPPSSTPYSTQQIVAMIRTAAAAHGVNGDCMVSLAQRESGLNPNAYNPSGPYDGLFQFWPPTYRAHGGTDIWDPRQQSDVAATMMAQGDGPGAWGTSC